MAKRTFCSCMLSDQREIGQVVVEVCIIPAVIIMAHLAVLREVGRKVIRGAVILSFMTGKAFAHGIDQIALVAIGTLRNAGMCA